MKIKLSNKYVMMGILAIFLITAGTYAMFTWRGSTTTDVAVSVDGVKILYVKGPDIIDATLIPTFTKEEGIVKEIKVSLDKTPQATVTLNFYLDVIAIAEDLKHETFKWQLYKNGSLVNGDNFSLVSTGNALTLTTNQTVTTTKDTYKLYIWIDGNVDNPDTMGGKAFSFKLRANGQNAIYEEEASPFDGTNNRPNLAEGMIPIKYNGTTWVKADVKNTSNDWYNYNDKIWANAVMVTEGTRTQHMSSSAGTPVPEADILAYLVWIPRYKYQLFNVEFAGITQREIQIKFENGTATTCTVSCSTSNLGVETCANKTNDNWYTHPAFTFGEEELTGLWVGKFETSHETLSSSTSDNLGCTNTSCDNANGLRVKPNVQSLRYNNVSNMFYATRSMSRSSNPYGFNTLGVDTHMMKNIEWGAVAYLTQSKYGRCTSGTCTEISLNNSSSFYTGRSMGAPGGSGIKTPTNEYIAQGYYTYDGKCSTIHANLPAPCNTGSTGQELTDKTLAYSASTTGNIYGIYDISGGAYEYTMATLVSTSGVLYTGQNADNNSDFTGTYGTGGAMYTGTPFPDSKYYDKYAYGTTYNNQTAYNRSHLGDATGETRNWNGDYGGFVYSSSSWFYRGGYYGLGTAASSFSFFDLSGAGSNGTSWRLALQSK